MIAVKSVDISVSLKKENVIPFLDTVPRNVDIDTLPMECCNSSRCMYVHLGTLDESAC